MDTFEEKELAYLYSLLDDPQEVVFQEVERKILSYGEAVIGPLMYFDDQHGSLNKARIRDVVQRIRYETATRRFSILLERSDLDINLESGVFILAKYGYPSVDIVTYKMKLDEMARDVLQSTGKTGSQTNTLLSLRAILFSELGFTGNRDDYYDPQNTYFNRVLDRRIGIPISLSTVMLLVARRLHLPLHGIGLPMHFLLQYDDGDKQFYIDAFNNGVLISRDQCKQMLNRTGIQFYESMLEPVSNKYMLERMIRNLLFAYQQISIKDETKNLTSFLLMFNPSYESEITSSDEEDMDDE